MDLLLERIANGRTDLVWDFVTQGHAATSVTREGVRPVQWCAYYGDVSAIRYLLGHGESLAPLGANLGLNDAAFHGHWQLCEFLIEQGAEVNAGEERTGETPLHCALSKPHTEAYDLVVRVLLQHGADPNRATRPAVETGAFMRDCRTRGETPLHRAAAFGGEATLDLLLKAGADRQAKDMNDDTPLAWASWYTRPDALLRKLCYGTYSIHPDRVPLRVALLGKPYKAP